MGLKKIFLRYHPPGIVLEYTRQGKEHKKEIDLYELCPDDSAESVAEQIIENERLLSSNKLKMITDMIEKIQSKLREETDHKFHLVRNIKAHLLPITNVAFNKLASKFATASYDRTCKIWDTETGNQLHSLEGHDNVVYTVAFNVPYGDKIATGSFDKSIKIWSTEDGTCLQTLAGHGGEVVTLQFSPKGNFLASGSMDTTARIWNIETGQQIAKMDDHCGEIISICFNFQGTQILTCSFDQTLGVWSASENHSSLGKRQLKLIGHTAEVSAGKFNFRGDLILSGSMDGTMRLWHSVSGQILAVFQDFEDEVLDVAFNLTGTLAAGCTVNGKIRCFNVTTKRETGSFDDHPEDEISRIVFSPSGNRLLTASVDNNARIWCAQTGRLIQTLEGHTQEIFSTTFSYDGKTIVTASKDNTCRIWR